MRILIVALMLVALPLALAGSAEANYSSTNCVKVNDNNYAGYCGGTMGGPKGGCLGVYDYDPAVGWTCHGATIG